MIPETRCDRSISVVSVCYVPFIEEAPVNMFRTFALLAVALTAVLIPSYGADTATLSLVGSSNKICQLTGDLGQQ